MVVVGARVAPGPLHRLDMHSSKPSSPPRLSVPTDVEANTVACALVLVCAVAVDAITAYDPLGDVEAAPASLRVSSIVLVAILASPKINGVNLADQRVVVGSCLLAAAFAGTHTASAALRAGDSLYVVLLLVATVQIFKSGGIESESFRPDTVHDKPHRRQTVSGLCAAMLFYVGARGVRAAFTLPQAAAAYTESFVIGSATVESTGYAHASLSVSVALGFGHGVVLATAALVGLHDEARVSGSAVVAFEVGFSGVMACVAALWAFMASAEGVAAMPVLYGASACHASRDTCPVAARARRFAIVNESTASLWIAGLSMLAFSFAAEKRFRKLHLRAASERAWQRAGFPVGVAALAASTAAVFQFGQFAGVGWHTDVVLLISLFAAFTACFSDVFVGELLYAAAMTYEQVALTQEYGAPAVFEHLTHLSLSAMLGILWLHIVVCVLAFVLERWFGFEVLRGSVLNTARGALATAGASLATALFLASALLIAASNGTLPTEGTTFRNGSVNRFVVAFSLDHFVPLFVFAPVYASRVEAGVLGGSARAGTWTAAAVLGGVLYAWVLSALQTAAPVASIVEVGPLAPAAVCATLAWAAGGFA